MQNFWIFLIVFLTGVITIIGQASPSPLKKCWEFKSSQMPFNQIASDNNSTIILPQDNSIIAIDKLGKILWNSEIGDNLLELKIIKERLFLITQDINDKGKISIQSLSLETGLTIWETEIAIEREIESVDLSNNDDFLLINFNKQLIYLIKEINGEVILNEKNSLKPNSDAIISNNIIYFSNQNNQVIQYSINERKSSILLQSKEDIEKIYITKQGKLLALNNRGQLLQFNIETKRKEWIFRAGGGFNSITEVFDGYIITSVDNYLYYLSNKKGKLIWKKRLEGRIDGVLEEENSQFISTVINGQTTLFSELKKGRVINQITLNGDSFFTQKPLLLDKLVILSTNNGIIAYSLSGC